MKKLMISLILSMQLLLPSTAVRATGIPTVDVLHIAETIVSYVQQLAAYGEMLTQSTLQGNQLTQMITDYNQMMTEYALLLNRVEGLHASLSGAEWIALVNEINKYYGSGDIGLTAQLDPVSATYATDVRTLLARIGLAPRTTTAVVADYAALGVNSVAITDSMDQANAVYSKYSNQHELVATNRLAMEELEIQRKKSVLHLKGLGAESDLQTLQLMATQQNMMMEQLLLQTTVSNQLLQSYEPASLENAQRKAAYVEAEKRRLARVAASPSAVAGMSGFSALGL